MKRKAAVGSALAFAALAGGCDGDITSGSGTGAGGNNTGSAFVAGAGGTARVVTGGALSNAAGSGNASDTGRSGGAGDAGLAGIGGSGGGGGADPGGHAASAGGYSGSGGRAGPPSGRGGAAGTAGSQGSAGNGPSGAGGSVAAGGSPNAGGMGVPGTCDNGVTSTSWAGNCPTAPPSNCKQGTWKAAGSSNASGDTLVYESDHFAVYSNGAITAAQGQAATEELESAVWPTYFGAPMYMPEPYCDSTTKFKTSVVVHSDYALNGGCWGNGYQGMWIGPNATSDHWGLAHEFMHSVQCNVGKGLDCSQGSNLCGWIYESHANFSPHQMAEYAKDMHCTEMLANAPHVYLGSTRDRYCNWQFMEYLKDKYCYQAVNDIWTSSKKSNDPFDNIMATRGWTLNQLNDFLGEWAMHNVTWDYKVSGAAMRSSYGKITDRSRPERRLRTTALEPLDADYATQRRFQSPYFWSPQRWGYNVARLVPDPGATTVTVRFRGVTQSGANSDWRWGLVATDSALTASRYSALQRGADAELTFCIGAGESVWLVVMATPSTQQHIVWDQAYTSIYRYPYMVELRNAWPEGFQEGKPAACPSGLTRIANGGGCGPSSLPSTVYVGPYAQVLGGTVTGDARIEDHAVVVSGTVSGGTVGALSIVKNFRISGSAKALASFYPLGHFETGQSISGSTVLYGDIEYRGEGYNRASGSCSGFVDSATCVTAGSDITVAPPYTWRP